MAHRPEETTSIRQSNYHAGYIRTSPDSSWDVVAHNNAAAADSNNNVLPCTYLDLATNIHLPGTEQRMKHGFPVHNSLRWNKEVHFHESLRLPSGMVVSEKGIVVGFEGTKVIDLFI